MYVASIWRCAELLTSVWKIRGNADTLDVYIDRKERIWIIDFSNLCSETETLLFDVAELNPSISPLVPTLEHDGVYLRVTSGDSIRPSELTQASLPSDLQHLRNVSDLETFLNEVKASESRWINGEVVLLVKSPSCCELISTWNVNREALRRWRSCDVASPNPDRFARKLKHFGPTMLYASFINNTERNDYSTSTIRGLLWTCLRKPQRANFALVYSANLHSETESLLFHISELSACAGIWRRVPCVFKGW
jgi:hypothetical protein